MSFSRRRGKGAKRIFPFGEGRRGGRGREGGGAERGGDERAGGGEEGREEVGKGWGEEEGVGGGSLLGPGLAAVEGKRRKTMKEVI